MKSTTFIIRTGKAAGKILLAGDWFRLGKEPGRVFRFHTHSRTAAGHEAIDAWGGTPSPDAERQWRCFYTHESFIPCKAPQAPAKKERVK